MADDFDSVWGTGGVTAPAASPPSPTRSLDPKTFDTQWLTAAPTDTSKVSVNTEGLNAGINAFTGGAIEAIPIIGPWLKDHTERVGAMTRAKINGTKYEDELAFVRGAAPQIAEAHPTANMAGQITGAVGPMLAGAGLAPRAFGMVGPLWERAALGGASNALINSADTAARGGSADETASSGLVGGGIGAGLPIAGKALGVAGRAAFNSGDRAVNALARRAEDLGIPIRFSQLSDSPFIHKLSQMAGKLPGSGMGEIHAEQQSAFNRAISRTFGEDADRITPEVMASAKKRLGKDFDAVATGTTIKVDTPFLTDVHKILADAEIALSDDEMKIVNKHISNSLNKVLGSGEISGEAYQGLTKTGSPLNVAINSKNSNVSHYAGMIKEALDDALERSAPPHLADKLRSARGQYKAMKTIEDLAEKSPTGDISPALLMTPVRQSYGNMAYGGGGDLADLARIGQRFMKAPPDSGTPLGHAALDLIMSPAALLAAGGGAGYMYGGDAMDIAKGAALLPATALAARGMTTLLNRPQAANALLQRLPAAVPLANQLSQPQH